jgi:DNA polymerase, archaea type
MDPLLTGHSTEENIVSLQPLPDGTMRLYRREGSSVVSSTTPFFPFFFLTDPAYVRGLSSRHWIKELEGDQHFRTLVAFERWSDLWEAVRQVMERYNRSAISRAGSYMDLPILYLRHDSQSQFLLQSGKTLFKAMEFSDIRRMQLDIETYTRHGFQYSNPARPDDRIILIALSDNSGWSHLLSGKELDEPSMLQELVRIIGERDPDVIEGHNILNFDLPYLLHRFELHGISPALGRDGSPVRQGDSLPYVSDRMSDFQFREIPGRHLIDTYMLLQSYDGTKRTLDNYGLRSAARHFGFAKSDRIYVQGDRISWYWDHEPDLLERYAMDDAEETRSLSEILSPVHFTATQFLPFPYGMVPRLSPHSRAEGLIVREYLRVKHSIPSPVPATDVGGGISTMYVTGVVGPVVHIGIDLLYPGILRRDGIGPLSDALRVFQRLISLLFELLPDARADEVEKEHPRSASIRTLLTSLASSLASPRFLFNDPVAAERMYLSGDSLFRTIVATLRQKGALIVEAGSDGILLVPSPDVRTPEAEEQFVAAVAGALPEQVRLTLDGRYRKMLSYKKKNHALLTYDNRITIRGSSFSSRSHERYIRHYISGCIDALLNNRISTLHELYANLARDILDQKLLIEDVVRTETFHETLDRYDLELKGEQRKKHMAYELARQHNIPVRPGERIAYYFAGSDENPKGPESCRLASEWDPNFSDINVAFYLKRLDEVSAKFSAFFTPQDFVRIFSVDGLFAFSADGIRILNVELEPAPLAVEDEPDDSGIPPLRIWLDRPTE